MIYLHGVIKGFRQLLYAHTHCAGHFQSSMRLQPMQLEIGTVDKNPLLLEFPSLRCKFVAEEGDFFVLPPDTAVRCEAVEDRGHAHTTAGFFIEMDSRIIPPPTETKPLAPSEILFPLVFKADKPLLAEFHRTVAKKSFVPFEKRNYFEDCADIMHVLNLVRGCLLGDPKPLHSSLSPAQQLYCSRAEEYVRAHIAEPIKVSQIAESLGVHKNYLTNLFSEYAGVSLTSYVNDRKLAYITELVLHLNCSLKEAAEAAGIEDTNYASRLFQKRYGMSFSEYKARALRQQY